jgi:hypothetical protein
MPATSVKNLVHVRSLQCLEKKNVDRKPDAEVDDAKQDKGDSIEPRQAHGDRVQPFEKGRNGHDSGSHNKCEVGGMQRLHHVRYVIETVLEQGSPPLIARLFSTWLAQMGCRILWDGGVAGLTGNEGRPGR